MNDIYDKVLERVDIVDIIGKYVPLKKNGSNYKACCPFHQENTPSFVVSQTKQIFKCFGCGVAGNAVSFVKEYEKVSYYEAALKLAKQYGIKVKVSKNALRQKDSKTSLILQVYSLTKDFYRENLALHGQKAVEYLASRSLSKNTIKTFELGFSLNSRTALYNYLRKNGINKDILLDSGIIKSNQKGYYDLFSDRIVFPIISANGMTVAFGARSMDGKMPKYINSPTTPVYQKSKELYGFHTTKHEISKVDKVIICEGYLDFLRLYESGYHYAVASLGTSLTDEQVNLLRRYCKNFYIVYDGDEAGTKAAMRAAAKVIEQTGEVRIVSLPEGEDPDSFLLKQGKEAFDEMLEASPTYLEHLQKNMDLDEAMHILVDVASSISNRLDKFVFVRKVAEKFGVEESVFSSQLKQKRVYSNQSKNEKKNVPDLGLEEQLLLSAMLYDKQTTLLAAKTLKALDFTVIEYRDIFSELQEVSLQNKLNFNALACQSKYPDLFNELIYRAKHSKAMDVKELLKSFAIKQKVKKFAQLDQKMKELLQNDADHAELKEVLEQKKRVKKELIELGYNKTKVG